MPCRHNGVHSTILMGQKVSSKKQGSGEEIEYSEIAAHDYLVGLWRYFRVYEDVNHISRV